VIRTGTILDGRGAVLKDLEQEKMPSFAGIACIATQIEALRYAR
jgi:hypothetical protein